MARRIAAEGEEKPVDQPTPQQPAEQPAPTGRSDAERVRRVTGGKRRGRRAAAPDMPLTTAEEREFWGRQVQSFWNNLASARGYSAIPDQQILAIGEPAALTAKKYLKDAQEEHPEYLLLFVLTPYIMGAIRVEWERWTRTRQAGGSDAGRERGGTRVEGQRENLSSEASPITKPFESPGH